jgi:hypothetical protein
MSIRRNKITAAEYNALTESVNESVSYTHLRAHETG